MKKAYQAGSGKSLRQRSGVSPAQRESEMRYCALFESSLDAIMTLDPPSWRFTSVNLATVRMFMAKDVAEFTSKEPWELSPEKLLTTEKLAVMGRLGADVAHELNNPLAIIIGQTQLILHNMEEKPSPLKSQLEIVMQSARR